MSLYNLVHGENPAATILLGLLGLTRADVPRYRDCYWNGKHIAVHTRTGGGNRDYYEHEESCRANYPDYFDGKDDPKGPWNADLRRIPTFVYDEDDDYDCTYATFYFTIPEQFAWVMPQLNASDATPAQKWDSFLTKMQGADKTDPQVSRVLTAMEPLFKQIEEFTKAEGK